MLYAFDMRFEPPSFVQLDGYAMGVEGPWAMGSTFEDFLRRVYAGPEAGLGPRQDGPRPDAP